MMKLQPRYFNEEYLISYQQPTKQNRCSTKAHSIDKFFIVDQNVVAEQLENCLLEDPFDQAFLKQYPTIVKTIQEFIRIYGDDYGCLDLKEATDFVHLHHKLFKKHREVLILAFDAGYVCPEIITDLAKKSNV